MTNFLIDSVEKIILKKNFRNKKYDFHEKFVVVNSYDKPFLSDTTVFEIYSSMILILICFLNNNQTILILLLYFSIRILKRNFIYIFDLKENNISIGEIPISINKRIWISNSDLGNIAFSLTESRKIKTINMNILSRTYNRGKRNISNNYEKNYYNMHIITENLNNIYIELGTTISNIKKDDFLEESTIVNYSLNSKNKNQENNINIRNIVDFFNKSMNIFIKVRKKNHILTSYLFPVLSMFFVFITIVMFFGDFKLLSRNNFFILTVFLSVINLILEINIRFKWKLMS